MLLVAAQDRQGVDLGGQGVDGGGAQGDERGVVGQALLGGAGRVAGLRRGWGRGGGGHLPALPGGRWPLLAGLVVASGFPRAVRAAVVCGNAGGRRRGAVHHFRASAAAS